MTPTHADSMSPCEGRAPSRVVVAAATAAIAGLVALTIIGEAASGQLHPVTDIGLGLVAVALVVGLPRRPVLVAVALALLAPASPVLVPASSGATLYVARTRSTRVAVAVTTLAALAHVLRGLWRPVGDLPFGWWVVIVVAVHAALLGWGALGRSHARVVVALRERAERAEAEQDAREHAARARERAAIAREMHDVLAHRLSLLATYSGALEMGRDAPEEARARAVGIVREHTHRALDELREIMGVLRQDVPGTEALRPQPGLSDLPALVDDSRDVGVDVALGVRVELPESVPPVIARTVYRIVQEALTNARRHAPGSPVQVSITGTPATWLEVTVRNGAAQGDQSRPGTSGTGTGLVGLHERVDMIGGHLEHGHCADGFGVRARLPWTG